MDDMTLERRVLEKMIVQLDLEDVDVENYNYDLPIFLADEEEEEGLGLDSVDSMELVVTIHEEFGLKVPSEDITKLRTVRAIADYIRENGANEG